MARLAIAAVAGEDDDVALVALTDGSLHGNRVNDAAVEHRFAVDLHDFADIGQRARCLHDVERTLRVMAFREIFGLPRLAVGHNHFVDRRTMEKRIEVEREQLVGQAVIEQVGIEDAAFCQQVAQADVVVFLHHVDVRIARASGLSADVRHAVAGACRHRHDVGELHTMLHKSIEHPAREDAAHAAAFEYQTCFVINLHHPDMGKIWLQR